MGLGLGLGSEMVRARVIRVRAQGLGLGFDARTARQAAARVLRDIAPQQREYGREAVGESHARPELGEHDAAHPYPRAELERLD